MGLLKDPILFSGYFGIDPKLLDDAGLIDPFLTVDTELFIDPVLLDKSSNPIIQKDAYQAFRDHFEKFVRLLAITKREGDPAWRAAENFLDLTEPPENGLGYGGSGRSGSSRPEDIRRAIMRTAKEIIELGSSDPEMVSLMGFFEEGVGPDTISDFTTRVIVNELGTITERFCDQHGIPTRKPSEDASHRLPHFKDHKGVERPSVLVPRDIVRHLPVARDWSEVQAAIDANQRIRARVNALLGRIAKPKVADMKVAVRTAALSSAELFDEFLRAIKDIAASYDTNKDAFGYFALRHVLATDPSALKQPHTYDLSTGIDAVIKVAHDTLAQFKHHVENGNLWEELWIDGKPKRERAAQLIYYALADCFCQANDIDISPEANMGGGPIDFKFSKGYQARVLVELKRSGGSVVHGYEQQLEHYKAAARTFHGIFVVIDFGDGNSKIAKIRATQRLRQQAGEPASDIIVIDARKKASASKRG